MARQIRKKSGTGVYHVMLRGINRQDIFEDEGDYQQMISILRGLVDRCDEHKVQLPPLCTFYAYCLMSKQVITGSVLLIIWTLEEQSRALQTKDFMDWSESLLKTK